ncbi:hypothetical protein [Emticicia soli]|uniref:DUF4296 domain-containing protein n=1 Tax=Emticicia soli TaxID=2027878 RepID=A0ABW5J6W4_9BACT
MKNIFTFLLCIFFLSSCSSKCTKYYTTKTRTLNITGLSGNIKSQIADSIKINVGEISIKPDYVKVDKELYRLDMLQVSLCKQLNSIKNPNLRRTLEEEYFKTTLRMIEIGKSAEVDEKKN